MQNLFDFLNIGGTLGAVGAFLWYLGKRNSSQEKASEKVSMSMDKMSDAINRNTKVLIRVARKHNLIDDADELMKN